MPLGFLLSLLLLTAGFLLSSQSRLQLRVVLERGHADKAQAAADGGLVRALAVLASNPNYTGSDKAALVGEGPESFRIQVIKAGQGIGDGRVVPADCLYVIALGDAPGAVTHRSSAMVKISAGGGLKGLYGLTVTSLTLQGGSRVDSYDSREGKYKKGGENGSVATNSVGRGSIRIQGGSRIEGPVFVGPEGKVEEKPAPYTANSDWTIWRDWGTTYSSAALLTKPMELPLIEFPGKVGTQDLDLNSKSKELKPGNYRDVTISNGAKLDLAPGTYIFRNLNLSGGAKIDLEGDGPVKIYIEKSFELNNGVKVSSSEVPPKLLQLYLGKDATYNQSGGTDISAVIYGPQSKVTMSNSATVYGAVVGAEVSLTGAATVHYDEALGEFELGGGSSGPAGITVLFRQRS